MEEYKIELKKGERCERATEKRLLESRQPYRKERGAMGAVYYVNSDKLFQKICADILLDYYKTDEISSYFLSDGQMEYYATLGCLIAVERETEEEEINKMLSDQNAVNLDGFFTFNLASMRSAWRGIAEIGQRLYLSCRDKEDKISLLLYMLDLQEKQGKKVTIKRGGLTVDGMEKSFVEWLSDSDQNLVMNVFMHRPECIEIDPGYKPTPELVLFLRSLRDLTERESI